MLGTNIVRYALIFDVSNRRGRTPIGCKYWLLVRYNKDKQCGIFLMATCFDMFELTLIWICVELSLKW